MLLPRGCGVSSDRPRDTRLSTGQRPARETDRRRAPGSPPGVRGQRSSRQGPAERQPMWLSACRPCAGSHGSVGALPIDGDLRASSGSIGRAERLDVATSPPYRRRRGRSSGGPRRARAGSLIDDRPGSALSLQSIERLRAPEHGRRGQVGPGLHPRVPDESPRRRDPHETSASTRP